ncbi:MAG: IPT/TIG domain-containing protein, partial [Patulibacter minatonensis]
AKTKYTYTALTAGLPVVTRITPNIAFANLGGISYINGTNLSTIKQITVGGRKAAWFQFGRTLVVVAPPLPRGRYYLNVTTLFGTSPDTAESRITFY